MKKKKKNTLLPDLTRNKFKKNNLSFQWQILNFKINNTVLKKLSHL